MDTKLYLTIAAIIALLYTFAFLLIPEGMSEAFSGFVEPHATLNLRFLGGANLAWGLILWFARDWERYRACLIRARGDQRSYSLFCWSARSILWRPGHTGRLDWVFLVATSLAWSQ
jgi:hypothetical protein